MKFLDRDHPMFRKKWVRWVCVLLPFGWSALEFSIADPLWGLLFAALGAYAAYELFLRAKD